MQTGTYISGLGHVTLIVWAVVGSALGQHQVSPKAQVTDISVISQAAFLALKSAAPSAETVVEQPSAPSGTIAPPNTPNPENKPRLNGFTSPDAPQSPGTSPDLKNVTAVPVSEAQIQAPDMVAPETTDQSGVSLVTPTAPLANRDQNGLRAPDKLAILTPRQQPAPRVDTTPASRPPTDAQKSDQTKHATTPDATATTPAESTVEKAPDQASTEIVTEAKQNTSSSAPIQSGRPKGRPARLAEKNRIAAAIAKALAQAQLAQAQGESASSGPPLTDGEKDGLRLAVKKCWNVGSLSSDAMRVTVTVGVALGRDGKILGGSVHLISSTDPTKSASNQAYEAARRAIMRCGAKGFDLPVEKYDHWRNIEMTFNPEKMRIR